MARLAVRFGEIRQSLHLIRQALDRLAAIRRRAAQRALRTARRTRSDGARRRRASSSTGSRSRTGVVEQCRIASPSVRNWPLFAESFRGDVLTDFGFIEHSFGLTPAGADR